MTRYAHLSKILVKVGDVVMKGGKHRPGGLHRPLHRPAPAFRGARKGIPLNPNKFLRGDDRPVAAARQLTAG